MVVQKLFKQISPKCHNGQVTVDRSDLLLICMYRAPRNVVTTFTQSVTRWHFRKAKFVQSCNIQFLNFFKRIC
jgi:hypothetical protein